MSEDKPVAVSEDTKIAIPITNLVSILGAVAISTWAYFGVLERLTSIERSLETHWEEIEENDDWIDNFQPPPQVQDSVTRVRQLEVRVAILEAMLEDK